MFIKHGDGQIVSVIKEDDLDEKSKETLHNITSEALDKSVKSEDKKASNSEN